MGQRRAYRHQVFFSPSFKRAAPAPLLLITNKACRERSKHAVSLSIQSQTGKTVGMLSGPMADRLWMLGLPTLNAALVQLRRGFAYREQGSGGRTNEARRLLGR